MMSVILMEMGLGREIAALTMVVEMMSVMLMEIGLGLEMAASAMDWRMV